MKRSRAAFEQPPRLGLAHEPSSVWGNGPPYAWAVAMYDPYTDDIFQAYTHLCSLADEPRDPLRREKRPRKPDRTKRVRILNPILRLGDRYYYRAAINRYLAECLEARLRKDLTPILFPSELDHAEILFRDNENVGPIELGRTT